ncbi:shufflon system plasmid conjugative transfer pilus tip adhesin PilV (plasmid) [Stenotrophomonas maltophilia]|uniref:shufflon system plasmid conjugative transfer pilus tip adhesin PilV n=1 Tax=Stenotrophomonas maltophilia TaxID=40324 RepID=UPI001D0CAE82|nr:shufflon system plasmid conjugative transfer pilus tip adhesin PilV [Stenotrophomonas maltophilia]UXF74685.1 shufflon system plasmid conjugative transfer pilus tip adhesin PilV [Stenotrophomonas maltophilia]
MMYKQRGLALIELVIALSILAAISIGIISVMRSQAQSKQVAVAANQLVEFTKATERYVQNEYTTIIGAAGPTTPVVITVATLQSAGLLPASYPAASVFGQVPTGRARKASASTLETLVIYSGGVALSQGDLDELAGLAAQQGVAGGYVGASDTTRAVGVLGAWSLPLSNFGIAPGAGRVASNVSYTNEAVTDTALHRQATPGRPELNRMNTAIDMANNDINGAGRVAAQNVDASNGITANQISIGKSSFGATSYPYETIQLAPGFNMRFAIGSREHAVFANDGGTTFNGNVNAANVNAANVYASDIVGYNSVQGSEVYANGWFRSRGQGGWYSEAYGGGWHMTDTTWIRAYNNKSIYTAGEMRAGTLSAEGRMTSNDLKLNRLETEGAGCGENGLTARTNEGKMLSCTNGVWRGGGGINTVVVTGPRAGCVDPTRSSFATCPAGTTLISGGSMWLSSCPRAKEEYRFTTMDRPVGNSWEARIEESYAMAYAICAY